MVSSSRLAELLAAVPDGWNGTTYPNDRRFVGRQRFMDEMVSILKGSAPISKSELEHLYPEDYLRLGSPVSTLLETVRAMDNGYEPAHVFSFASKTFPLIAAFLAAENRVYVYGPRLFHKKQEQVLKTIFQCDFAWCSGKPKKHADGVVVEVTDKTRALISPNVDAVVGISDGFLYIINADKVPPSDRKNKDGTTVEGVHTLRKRFSCPITTPEAYRLLRGQPSEPRPYIGDLLKHLKQLAGCEGSTADVLITTTGLSALASLLTAALDVSVPEGIDLVMCSTAYGGSSQQADILTKRQPQMLQKHTFDIQGPQGDVLRSLSAKLDAIKESGSKKPLTIVAVEYPTNPDMKDCDLRKLEPVLIAYEKATQSKLLLMLDTTFSPQSMAGKSVVSVPVIIWNSLSKSVAGGFTTGGSLVANHHPLAKEILARAHAHAHLTNSRAKVSQLKVLVEKHSGVERRVMAAHGNARAAVTFLEQCVERLSGKPMKVNFVTQAQIDKNVTPATFSFNLPAPDHLQSNSRALAALAQDMVDRLVESYPEGVKPCVSFGQDNNLVYATVPATSTQGVISAADKEKQAVGGVQLVRFSFPPQMDMPGFQRCLEATVRRIYQVPKAKL
eukprot:gb/GEZN01004209.1/.p1 GENE.gb/GEZN01004209.1/~~gb/GEZN01004209.1/.p1  ORF type:complete len:616 (-),score=74.91 gb/GEZN01004209.1/:127-1974(-)